MNMTRCHYCKSLKTAKEKIIQVFAFTMACLTFFSAPVSALSSANSDKFSANNILFYDPDANNCKPTDNGIFKGKQFTLDETELARLVRAAKNENGCNIEAIKTELSIMANLYEQNGSSFSSLGSYIENGTWFASSTKEAYRNGTAAISDEELSAAKDVLLNGNRTLPPQITEHDCIGSIKGCTNKISNDNGATWITVTSNDKDKFVKNKTWIQTIYSEDAHYVFYRWAGGNDSTCGDPFGYYEDNPPEDSYSSVTGSNVNYAGAQVWSEPELQAIEANRPFYEEAAKQYNFPWPILAVLHSHETSLRRYNPPSQWDASKSEGVYQLHSWVQSGRINITPAESISEEEFRQQTLYAAQFIVENNSDLDLNKPDDIKKLFFRYNGTASVYKQKALDMGFSPEEAENGEGSAYVMNRYDAMRDPTSSGMHSAWPGRFVGDHNYDPTSTSNGFGAFVQYEALNGNSSCNFRGGTIAETALLLSWDGYKRHATTDPKPEYIAAMKEVGSWTLPCGHGGECPYYGASCDQFVATTIRYSGADPNFPIFHGSYTNASGTDSGQNYYMDEHPEMYEKIENLGNSSNLQPGDIFVVNNHEGYHIFLYAGQIDGKDYQASASWGGRTGEHFEGISYRDYNEDYSIYRRIN